MNEFEISSNFIVELAKTGEAMIGFMRRLSAVEGVSDVIKGIDCRLYEDRLIFEQYVEAKIGDKASICWWIDIVRGDKCWEIEANVSVVDGTAQIIREISPITAATVDEFSEALTTLSIRLFSLDDLRSGKQLLELR